MHIRFVQVDAFTPVPFSGNPAAVVTLTTPRDDEEWMQRVAREMNLSETAFVHRRPDGSFDLRWFTPTVEVDLCGHATLATAHALWENGQLQPSQTAQFHTRSGVLAATRDNDWIELDFPATPDTECEAPAGLVKALGVTPRYVGKSRFDYLVELESEDAVRDTTPDFAGLSKLGVRGVMITAASATPDTDFVSRFFAPGSGINEDPVTGSAHCCLAPFWSRRLGKTDFLARQISARGGFLKVRLDGDRVRLGGQAVTVMKGEILV